ncbi:MAG: 30S ribosomal protein S14 [Promethearchaeota archaeon]
MSSEKSRKIRSSKGSRHCIRCGTHKGIIRQYNLNICRRCFREVARKGLIGFKKYD